MAWIWGIADIAGTSDGLREAGRQSNQVRHRNRRLRARLQAEGATSAKRLLRKLSGREVRFEAGTDHRIAKIILTEAQRTCRGIALEDLGDIRERVRLRQPQRVTPHVHAADAPCRTRCVRNAPLAGDRTSSAVVSKGRSRVAQSRPASLRMIRRPTGTFSNKATVRFCIVREPLLVKEARSVSTTAAVPVFAV
ncbi:hypothetical protein AB0M95_15880 [Sphaerisporangium sp. NPDC051017]|uniref:hypothetical protein n=1 Tax=Sphaerisporangium sp. NPDC051017 TaxID=3154636 RepID=UPI003423F189